MKSSWDGRVVMDSEGTKNVGFGDVSMLSWGRNGNVEGLCIIWVVLEYNIC